MSASDKVRVRFAPSPTGYLHIGSARTALFNYLFAKRHGGKFILRIEDTDQQRSTIESLRNILEGLLWLNIKWDEGPVFEIPTEGEKFDSMGSFSPYFQAERCGTHLKYGQELLESGHAYHCDCPPTETIGTSKCKCRKRKKKISDPENAAVKFAVPKGETGIHDLIVGDVSFENDAIEDFLIIRPNGCATYNFAVVCDDLDMEITHVIRGSDHLSNTPKQVMIYHALGRNLPEFGHIPLIHGDDGVRLSKRHGAVSVGWYQEKGFLPEAVVNYLARLGWSDGTDEEFFTLTELENKFDLMGVTSSPAQFDFDKLIWFNGKYIRQLSDDEMVDICSPYLKSSGLLPDEEPDPEKREWLKKMLSIYKVRLEHFDQIAQQCEFFFRDPKEYILDDLKKAKVDSDAIALLDELHGLFSETEDFTESKLEENIRKFCDEKGIKLGRLIHPLRLAVTGRRATPGMFETLEILGQSRVLRRLGKFVKKVQPVD